MGRELNSEDLRIQAAYLRKQWEDLKERLWLMKLQSLQDKREKLSEKERRLQFVITPERVASAKRVLVAKARQLELQQVSDIFTEAEWDHKIDWQGIGDGLPKFRLSNMEIVMMAAALAAVVEAGGEMIEEDDENRRVSRGEDASLEGIPF